MNQHAHVHLLAQQALRVFGDYPHGHRACVGIHQCRDLVHLARKGVGIDSGNHLRRVADAHGGEVRAEQLCHHPDTRQIGNGKAGRGPCLEQLAGRDELLHHGPGHRRANDPCRRRHRPSFADGIDGLGRNLQRDQRSERRVAVRFGVGGVGLRLRVFALRDPVVLQQVFIQVGELAVGTRRRDGLLIRADGRCEVRRIHGRERLALGHLVSDRHQRARHRSGEGRQHAGGLVVVEIDRGCRLHSTAKA